jgi:hypothetical protein
MKRYWARDLVDDETGEEDGPERLVVLAADADALAARVAELEADKRELQRMLARWHDRFGATDLARTADSADDVPKTGPCFVCGRWELEHGDFPGGVVSHDFEQQR